MLLADKMLCRQDALPFPHRSLQLAFDNIQSTMLILKNVLVLIDRRFFAGFYKQLARILEIQDIQYIIIN